MTSPERNCRTCQQPIPQHRIERWGDDVAYCTSSCNPKNRSSYPIQGPHLPVCLHCGEPHTAPSLTRKFCSTACRIANHERQPKPCPSCGDLKPKYSRVAGSCARCSNGIGPTLEHLPMHGPQMPPQRESNGRHGPRIPNCLQCNEPLEHPDGSIAKRFCSRRCGHVYNGHYMTWESRTRSRAKRRKQKHDGDLTQDDWHRILAEHEHRCHWCNSPGKMTIDHVQPLALDGQHTADNVVPACLSCNAKKGALAPEEWHTKMRMLGMKQHIAETTPPRPATHTSHEPVVGSQASLF